MTRHTKYLVEVSFFIIFLVLLPFLTIIPLQSDTESRSPLALDKKVLAFYYSWYGNSTNYTDPVNNITDFTETGWSHWNGTITDHPELGAYDSCDPNLIKSHFSMAEYAGIDGFICSWWGINHYTDISFKDLLTVANNVSPSLNLTIYYESYQDRLLSLSMPERENVIVNELNYILETYSSDNYFLKVNNIPVIFIYLTYTSPFSLWNNVVERVKSEHSCYIIGDINPSPSVRDEVVQIFDGIHSYNPGLYLYFQQLFTGSSDWNVAPLYVSMAQTAHFHNKLYAATVIPGYNDTVARPNGFTVDRNGMQTYDTLWQTAIQASADWILITSFNEWHEGTEIESSVEYHDTYLNRTQYWTTLFHSGL